MKMTLTQPNSAWIVLTAEELNALGIAAEECSLSERCFGRIILPLFTLLEQLCGLRRRGCFTTVECCPYRSGTCGFRLTFTRLPAPQGYIFDTADDLLDALHHLHSYCSTQGMNIQPLEDKFFMYIPQPDTLTPHDLVILSEYAAE